MNRAFLAFLVYFAVLAAVGVSAGVLLSFGSRLSNHLSGALELALWNYALFLSVFVTLAAGVWFATSALAVQGWRE